MTTEYKKPLPMPINPTLTKPFWEATKRHELVIQRCNKCDSWVFYPRERCPECLADPVHLEWTKVSGKGRLHTFTIVHQPANNNFLDDAPYAFVIIQLDEGPRMPGNVVNIEPQELQIDMRMEAVFEDVTPEWTLVKWKPA